MICATCNRWFDFADHNCPAGWDVWVETHLGRARDFVIYEVRGADVAKEAVRRADFYSTDRKDEIRIWMRRASDNPDIPLREYLVAIEDIRVYTAKPVGP